VGFPERVYEKPEGKLVSGARSNVVDRWMGGVTAPVAGSTVVPA
jgi:hypothetical protein